MRSSLMAVSGALLVAACAGGGMAPVVDRSTTAASNSSGAGSGVARANAGTEAADTDWTAKVRPLGDTGSTASRPLPSESGMAAPVPVSPAPAGTATQSGQSVPPVPPAPPRVATSPATVNPAVVSLLNSASAQSRAGDNARAAATLERAIAIEPNNPWLWHRLADVRIKEGRLDQGAQLAAKSNTLAGTDRSLQAENWKLIAAVRRRQGDTSGAATAESEAARLSN